MSRILLADDSPHAQRMGERILREEGYEVVTVTDGDTVLKRLADADPDVVFADVSLPTHSGYEICKRIKANPNHKHVRVILTAGLLEAFDEELAKQVQCDGILKKPFESSVVLATVKPLVQAATHDKGSKNGTEPAVPAGRATLAEPEAAEAKKAVTEAEKPKAAANATLPITPVESIAIAASAPPATPPTPPAAEKVDKTEPPTVEIRREEVPVTSLAPVRPMRTEKGLAPISAEAIPRAVPVRILTDPVAPEGGVTVPAVPAGVDPERVRAAVTLALDAALPGIIDKITEQVLIALGQ